MRYADFSKGYVIKLEPGEEFHDTLLEFVHQKRMPSAFFQGIGSLCDIELGFFCPQKNAYERHAFKDNHELINASGNISIEEGKHFAHTHVVLSNAKCQTIGGHLFKGKVTITAEIFLFHVDIALNRKKDETFNFKSLTLPHLFVR